ncbi:hypothetical protein [Aequorivita todarodis]|uniref:hypothetical protein n=1 Tax=Aequorivita todarodis TaxID=2036821 RepID=UPI0023508F4C|nr:hypothetical protein [Aequorivita todarodis]
MPLLFFMKFIIPLLLSIGFIFSCGNSSEENQNQSSSNDVSIIFGTKGFDFPPLSAPAKEQAIHWGVLEDFLLEAKNVNGSNYQDLRNRSELLKQYSDSLLKKIPDTLNTKPINSRLLVLKTRSALLFQAAHQATIDSSKVQNSMEELNVAVKNLIVQLNEKFQKDNIDSQRREDEETELKKQQRYKDSIMDLELQDKKNKKV